MVAPVQYVTASEFLEHALPSEAFRNIPTPVIDRALQWGSRVAAGYIRKRKVLPLQSWGEDVRDVVTELAAYRLMTRKGYSAVSGANDTIRQNYEDAIATLKDIARGLIELVDCVDSTETPTVDEAGPLMATDPLVNWNYQTRGRGCG